MKIEKKNNGSFLEFLGKASRNFLMGIDFRDRLFKLRSVTDRGLSRDIFTIDERNSLQFSQDVYMAGRLILDRAIIERINRLYISNIGAESTFTFGATEYDDVNNGTIQLISTDGTTVTYKIKNDNSADATAASPEFNSGSNAKQTAKNFIDLVNSSNGHDGKIIASYNRQGEDTEGKVVLEQLGLGEDGNTTITTASSFDNACSINAPSAFTMTNEINNEDFKNFTTLLLNLDGALDIVLPDTGLIGGTNRPASSLKNTTTYDTVYGRRLYVKRIDRSAHDCKIKSGNPSLLEKTTVSFQAYIGGAITTAGNDWIQINGSASTTDDIYNDLYVEITAGDAKGNVRKIIDYYGADKIAKVDKPFEEIPDRVVASTYKIYAGIKDSDKGLGIFSEGDVIKVEGASNAGNNDIFTIANISEDGGTISLTEDATLTAESASNAISIYSGLINNDKELSVLSGDYVDLICDGDRWYTKNSSLIDRQLQINGQLLMNEISSTDVRTNTAGRGIIYVKNDAPNTLKFEDDGGTTYDLGSNWHGSTTTIQILPRDFMGNEDGSFAGFASFDDTGTLGLRVSNANTELNAFVPIPKGYKATQIHIYANQNRSITAYRGDLTTGAVATRGTGACNTTLDIDADIEHGTNYYLGVRIVTTATTDLVYGGLVTIERV